jgi:hypothetical protein
MEGPMVKRRKEYTDTTTCDIEYARRRKRTDH